MRTHCLPTGHARPSAALAELDEVAGGLAETDGCLTDGCLSSGGVEAASASVWKRYVPVVRSILRVGPSAISLPRTTTTPPPSSAVLLLTSKSAHSAVALWSPLDVISTLRLASMRSTWPLGPPSDDCSLAAKPACPE